MVFIEIGLIKYVKEQIVNRKQLKLIFIYASNLKLKLIMSGAYFTRLTSNFENWSQPSGPDGKCQAADPSKPIYEQIHGFGWEEWLFEEYFKNQGNIEASCLGFLEAFNGKNLAPKVYDRIYLFTRVGENKAGIEPGDYYLGYIDSVKRIQAIKREEEDVENCLVSKGIKGQGFRPMLPFAYNISFKVKDVHVDFERVYERRLELRRGQYRFALYDLKKHENFLKLISRFSEK